jgi:DNA replication protein DnaC
MSTTSELAHLFRVLKAPAAANALPKLAERARSEDWSYERFIATILKTEVDSHGGQARIKAARFPARKTLEEFDFSFQRSVKKTAVPHLAQLDFSPAKRTSSSWARPDRQDPPLDRARDPRLPRGAPRRVQDRDRRRCA